MDGSYYKNKESASGIVCHSFWKGEGTEIYKGLFVNYQTEQNIEKLFGSNFKTLVLQEYEEFESKDSISYIGKGKG